MFQQHPKPLCGARFVVPNSGSALKTGSLPQPRNKWQSPCLLAPLSAAGPPCAYIAATTVQWMGPCWDKRRHFCVCGSATAWVAGIALSCHTLQKHFETKPQRLLINAPISLGKKNAIEICGPKGVLSISALRMERLAMITELPTPTAPTTRPSSFHPPPGSCWTYHSIGSSCCISNDVTDSCKETWRSGDMEPAASTRWDGADLSGANSFL